MLFKVNAVYKCWTLQWDRNTPITLLQPYVSHRHIWHVAKATEFMLTIGPHRTTSGRQRQQDNTTVSVRQEICGAY